MPSGKVVLEEGPSVWAGAGYQPPSSRQGGGVMIPPGWNDDPGGPETAPPAIVLAARDPAPMVRSIEEIVAPPSNVAEVIATAIAMALGDEYVSMTNQTAMFMGHELQLSEDGLMSIRAILGMEVCASLAREQERIAASVFHEGLRAEPAGRRPDVPEVQGPQSPMEPHKPKRGRKVRRVRKPETDPGAGNVPNLPGAEAGEA